MGKTILCLDLGSRLGWALSSPSGQILSGTIDLKAERFKGGGVQFLNFIAWLDSILELFTPIDIVYFEEFRQYLGVELAHIYGGFLGQLTKWCEENNILYQCVAACWIKKAITGKLNASKQEIIRTIKKLGHQPKDHNEADVLAILYMIYAQPFSGRYKESWHC